MSDVAIQATVPGINEYVADFGGVADTLTASKILEKVDLGSADMIIAENADGVISLIVLSSSGDAIAIPAEYFSQFV